MRSRSLVAIVSFLTINLCAATAFAQMWAVDVSGAAASPLGATRDHLKQGWNVDVGANQEITSRVGLREDFGYYHLGVTDQVLKTLKMPSGQAHMVSLTIGPTWRVPISSHVNVYLLSGIGWYRRTVEFTQPTLGVIHIIDPWWGYVGSEIVPANQVLGSVTSNAFGGNIGGGVGVPLGSSGSEIFVDVRYHRARTKSTPTSVLPVSFGLRWGGRSLNAP